MSKKSKRNRQNKENKSYQGYNQNQQANSDFQYDFPGEKYENNSNAQA